MGNTPIPDDAEIVVSALQVTRRILCGECLWMAMGCRAIEAEVAAGIIADCWEGSRVHRMENKLLYSYSLLLLLLIASVVVFLYHIIDFWPFCVFTGIITVYAVWGKIIHSNAMRCFKQQTMSSLREHKPEFIWRNKGMAFFTTKMQGIDCEVVQTNESTSLEEPTIISESDSSNLFWETSISSSFEKRDQLKRLASQKAAILRSVPYGRTPPDLLITLCDTCETRYWRDRNCAAMHCTNCAAPYRETYLESSARV